MDVNTEFETASLYSASQRDTGFFSNQTTSHVPLSSTGATKASFCKDERRRCSHCHRLFSSRVRLIRHLKQINFMDRVLQHESSSAPMSSLRTLQIAHPAWLLPPRNNSDFILGGWRHHYDSSRQQLWRQCHRRVIS